MNNKPHKRTYLEIEFGVFVLLEVIAIGLLIWHGTILHSMLSLMKQGEFNFDKFRQLSIPFSMGVSENQDLLEQAKVDAKNPKLSESERRDALAAIEVLKQTPLVPMQ